MSRNIFEKKKKKFQIQVTLLRNLSLGKKVKLCLPSLKNGSAGVVKAKNKVSIKCEQLQRNKSFEFIWYNCPNLRFSNVFSEMV